MSNKEGKEMYRCKECGHLFEDGEQASVLTFGADGRPVAREPVCPVCGGYYDETVPCKICGRECLEDELSNEGYCMDCLRGELDSDAFYAFAISEDVRPESVTTLEDFVFVKIFGLDSAPPKSSVVLKDWCKLIYMTNARRELRPFLDDYMTTFNLWPEFSEFIAERGKNEMKGTVRDQVVVVTCTADEKKEIERRAREADRTVSSYIRWLLRKAGELQND